MHNRIPLVALVWLGLAMACATIEPGPPPVAPSAEARSQYGAVSDVFVPEPVQYKIHTPTSGWATGLFVGTARGLVAIPVFPFGAIYIGSEGLDPGLPLDPTAAMFVAAMGAAATPFYFPYSVINGAMTAVPRAEIKAALPAFQRAIEDPSLPDRLVAEFSRRAELHLAGGFVPEDEATTVMEIRLLSIRSGWPLGFVSLDEEVEILAVASVRVVRRADNHIISEGVATDGTETPADRRHRFLVWAAQDAGLLRHRLDEAMDGLAESLADLVFVGDVQPIEPPQPRPQRPPLFTPDEIPLIF